MKKFKNYINLLLVLSFLSGSLIYFDNNYNIYNNSIETLSRFGSFGGEVREIQTKLKRWGYYKGAIDGIYGSATVAAVKYFQRYNGLTPDGIAGTGTLNSMGIFPNGSLPTSHSSYQNNLSLLARVVNGEARGESYKGKVAIAAVILNRVRSSLFPKTIAGVIYQPGAFDAVSDGQINLAPNAESIKAAQDALNGWDPTYGSIYYYNPRTATNRWIKSLPIAVTIGNHVFSRGRTV